MGDDLDIGALIEGRYRGYVDRAKQKLVDLFTRRAAEVFYERQLQLSLEDEFFHWVTSKALQELVSERRIGTFLSKMEVDADTAGPTLADEHSGGANVRFYFSLKHRYWKRQATKILKLIREYSDSELTRAYGWQAELMFDAALPKRELLPVSENVNEYRGKRWEGSGHNLDRIFERDGIGYGVEIKNTLRYIDPAELNVKLDTCRFLGLKPLFIARMMPKIYIWEVIKRGGFCLIFKNQLYPFHLAPFAARIRDELGLPIESPAAIEIGRIDNLSRWHEGELKKQFTKEGD